MNEFLTTTTEPSTGIPYVSFYVESFFGLFKFPPVSPLYYFIPSSFPAHLQPFLISTLEGVPPWPGQYGSNSSICHCHWRHLLRATAPQWSTLDCPLRTVPLSSKHLVYRYVLHRHRLIGPWSLAGVLLQLIYIAGNMTCFSLGGSHVETQISPLSRAGLRAGTLSVINLIPLFASPHLDTLADLLGVTLTTVRQMHRSVGVMAVLLTVFHVIVAVVTRSSFALSLVQNQFAVIVSVQFSIPCLSSCLPQGASSLGCVVLLSLPLFRRPSYELFLRGHHALSTLGIFAIWRHLPPDRPIPRCSLYVLAGLFAFLSLVQAGFIFYQNGLFRSGHSQAYVKHDYGALKLRMQCRKPLKIKAGQHINLWIPSVSFWSFLQSHPFVVISWSEKPQDQLDLLIEPRRGLTRELLNHAKSGQEMYSPVLFSGPHGRSVGIDGYEQILMIASGFGIAAHLPYLKQIIHGYNARQLCTRRVHLVWQVGDIGKSLHHQ